MVSPPVESLTPVRGFVFVDRFEGPTHTPSGLLYLPPTTRGAFQHSLGTVVAIGPEPEGYPPLGFRVGDRVIYDPSRAWNLSPDRLCIPKIGVLAVVVDSAALVEVGEGSVAA